MPEDEGQYRLWDEINAELAELQKLPELTRGQAERWASLCGTRDALYRVPHDYPEFKAIPNTVTGTWHLVRMHRNRKAERGRRSA